MNFISSPTIEDTLTALRSFVVPIFAPDVRGRPEVTGSGVLLRLSAESFLLTAAHVLDETEDAKLVEPGRSLYLPIGRELEELDFTEGYFRSCLPSEGGLMLDEFDVSLLRLRTEMAKRLSESGARALVPANIMLTDEDSPKSREIYCFMGYPSSYTSRRPDRKTLRRKCFSYYSQPLTPGDVRSKGLLPEMHVVVPLANRKTVPKLGGMSGGAVWSLRGHLQKNPRLAAIAIEDRKREGVLVGVRAKVFVAALAACFPEFAFALPSVPTIKVSL